MSADNFTGVWFNGTKWIVKDNMSMSDYPRTIDEATSYFTSEPYLVYETREAALVAAHDLDAHDTEYGVCEVRPGNECCYVWHDAGCAPRLCTLPVGHDGRHEMHGPTAMPNSTLISWDDRETKADAPNERVAAARERIAKHLAPDEPKVKRVPVTYLWSKLNWDFLKLLAEIAHYAEGKYGSAEQYTAARLEGEKSPINHAFEHLRAYSAGEKHDKFGTHEHQLAAVAYNVMMEFFYQKRWGFKPNPVMAAMKKPEEDQ